MTEDSVLETLRRVPDRIILATMGRDLDMGWGHSCLCGWFLREKLAEIENVGASELEDRVALMGRVVGCTSRFGGTMNEWEAIYWGVVDEDDLPVIERAFVRRVDEAVFGAEA